MSKALRIAMDEMPSATTTTMLPANNNNAPCLAEFLAAVRCVVSYEGEYVCKPRYEALVRCLKRQGV